MNRMKRLTGRKILLATVALCAFGIAKAQNAQAAKDTLTLTLDKALTIALDENPTMKVAAEEIALKKVAGKEAWQSLLPEASIAGSLDHTIKAAEMKLNDMSFKMGQDGTNTANAGLSINLPLFAPAVYRTMSMTKTDIELAVEKSRASKLDLVNQVSKAYYQLMLAQDSYDVLLGSYKLAEDNFNIVNAKYEQGAVSEYDKISAEVQMRSIKPNVISAANGVTLAKLQLKVLMGITADVELKTEDSLTNYETAVFANQLKDEEVGLENNTTMKQLDLNMKMLEKSLKVAKSSFIPTLSMSFSYNYQSLYNPNINFFEYNWSNSSSLMFNLSIPLYKASNFTKVKSARIQMRQLDWNRIDTERKLNMEIVSYRNNMAASSEQVVSNKENVMQAEKAVLIAGKRYDVGKGTVLELNSSQVSLTQAQLTYNQFRYYDPNAGNYLSQDPIGLAGGNPTLYGYVFDPNTQIDPFGLDCGKKKITAIAPYYPPNDGALGKSKRIFLMPGDKVDRFGNDTGKYLSPKGTPFEMRALPPNNTGKYNVYEVIKPFEVEASTIAPAFGKIGLGTQYKTSVPIKILVKRGILKPV